MNIEQLADAIYEDLNPAITTVRRDDDGTWAVSIVCDDWDGAAGRRHIRLRCRGVREASCSPCAIGYIDYASTHPLLLDHVGPQAELYFGSRPVSVGEIYLAAHRAIETCVGQWRDARRYLVRSSDEFALVLDGGHGLLARGPLPLIEAIEQRIDGRLTLSRLATRTLKAELGVLIIGREFVVCESVEVAANRLYGAVPQ